MSDYEFYVKNIYNPLRSAPDWKASVGRLFMMAFRDHGQLHRLPRYHYENFNEIEFLLSKPDVVDVLVEMATVSTPTWSGSRWRILCHNVFEKHTMLIHELLSIMYRRRESEKEIFSNGCRIIKLLLEKGVDINFVPTVAPPSWLADELGGNTPLIFVLRLGLQSEHRLKITIEILKFLIDNGADVNVANADGQTPLHVAIVDQSPSVIELLLEHGAQPGIEDKQGVSIPNNPDERDLNPTFPIYHTVKPNIEFVKNFIKTEIAYKKLALMKHDESHPLLRLLTLDILKEMGTKLDELSPDKILLRRPGSKKWATENPSTAEDPEPAPAPTPSDDNIYTGIYCYSDTDCIGSLYGKYCGEDKRCKPRRGGGGKKSKKRKSKHKSKRKKSKKRKTRRRRR